MVIDRSVEPVDGNIILGVLNGEFTVKRIVKKGDKIFLVPESKKIKFQT
ncbi:MAG: S24 family peptidase [Bacteroidales bacterium]|nr:S24 family peptidase [Bacteroidales bacterium]